MSSSQGGNKRKRRGSLITRKQAPLMCIFQQKHLSITKFIMSSVRQQRAEPRDTGAFYPRRPPTSAVTPLLSQVFNEAYSRWQPSTSACVNSSVLPLESERRSEESSAEGTAFTLLHEGDTHVSDALEHSDRLWQPSSLQRAKCMYSAPYVSRYRLYKQNSPFSNTTLDLYMWAKLCCK